MRRNINKKLIGLITPYTGDNLGDAAIQHAMIQNIRKRIKDADIYLITLFPEATESIHGIKSFPLSSNVNLKKPASEINDNTIEKPTKDITFLSNVKNRLSKISWLYLLLSYSYHKSMLFIRFPYTISKEVTHLLRVHKLMKSISLLLVSGGGQLDDYWGGSWAHPYALFKWGLIAKIVGARYVFLSVGHCSLDSKLSKLFIKRALKFASYRSYRDNVSKNLLEYLNFTHRDEVYPDLAFSYKNNNLVKEGNYKNDKLIGISPIAFLSKYWPRHDNDVFNRYIFQLSEFATYLIYQGFSIVLFTTDEPDRHIIGEFHSLIYNNINGNYVNKLNIKKIYTVEELLMLLKTLNCVIASRLHGILISHLIFRPVLAISYDRKVDTYMSDMEFTDYCLDIHKIQKIQLVKKFEAVIRDEKLIKLKLQEKIQLYSKKLDSQYDHILAQHGL